MAIVLVIAYHVDETVVPAGHLGVVVFFVLTGYLITRIAAAEIDETGRLDIGSFYLRRGLRMVPGLIVLCVALLAAGTDWSVVAPTLGFYANYARIGGLDLELLTHTWFLSVLAHFYLLWPILLAAVPRRLRLRVVGVLTVSAIAWRMIAIGATSPGWVYNATDTNAAALLAGCWLGVLGPGPWRSAGWSVPALAVLALTPAFATDGPGFPWGYFVAIALSVAAIQYAITGPPWLETPAVAWFGEISFGLYLWHYVFLEVNMSAWAALPLASAIAAISWYLIEKPIIQLPTRPTPRSERREGRPSSRTEPAARPALDDHR